MKKNAFTILELIFVIIVIGILAAVIMPRINRDHRQEAADSILSAIRYTQHLALNDDKTDPSESRWQKKLWHIRFSMGNAGNEWFYTISSNNDNNSNVDFNETAIDPSNGKRFYNLASTYTVDPNESPDIFLTKRFGINSIDFTGCNVLTGSRGSNAAQHIAFDQLGRPHKGVYGGTNDYHTIMQEDCTLTFGFQESGIADLSILIHRDTGYAEIVGQNDS